MASGLEVYDALKEATREMTRGAAFGISLFDSYDLGKLTADDLVSRGYDEKIAQEVSGGLLQGRLDELGAAMGLTLQVDRSKLSLVPQQRIRETAGVLADEGQSFDEMMQELDRIRHPERYVR